MFSDGLGNRVINRHAEDFLSPLARGNAGNDFCPIAEHRFGVETAHVPGYALHEYSGVFTDDDAHIDYILTTSWIASSILE